MKTVKHFNEVGSRFGKATGWRHFPGYWEVTFTDDTRITVPLSAKKENESLLDYLDSKGYDTEALRKEIRQHMRATGYPDKPEVDNDLYQHNYGYEKPIELLEWQWSSTFGRWGRMVKFADGWFGFTYPKVKSN